MKITKLILQNFKGIGPKVEIPLSPITLLFGKNSAGKSTVLHAMLYTQELLERLNVNADILSGAGDGLDLGGFENFVHKGSENEGITIRYDLDFSGTDWVKDFPINEFMFEFREREVDLSDRGADVSTGWLELNIGYGGEPDDALIIRKSEVGLDGVWLLKTTVSLNRFLLEQYDMSTPCALINEVHPLLALPGEEDEPETGNIMGVLHEKLRTPFYDLYFSEEAVPGPLSLKQIEEIFKIDLEDCECDQLIYDDYDNVNITDIPVKIVPFSGGIFELALLDKGQGKEIAILHDWFPKTCHEKVSINSFQSEREKKYFEDIGLDVSSIVDSPFDYAWRALADFYEYNYYVPIKEISCKNKAYTVANPDFSKFDQFEFKIGSVEVTDGDTYDVSNREAKEFLRQLFARLVYGPIQLLRQELNKLRYIGPIRHIPSRAYTEQLSPSMGRWAKGLAAWDALFYDPKLCATVSDTMKRHLNLRYSIQRKEYIELELDSEVMNSLKLLATQYEEYDEMYLQENVLDPLDALPKRRHVFLQDEKQGIQLKPHDVGVGLSQVIPVVVGAYVKDEEGQGGILAVEQPELHVHPAVEVGLGDVFIEANRETGRMMLIETHSEHLLLRLMRRIRETSREIPDFPEGLRLTKESLTILFVEIMDGECLLRPMPINDQGELVKAWPGGFFEEDLEELF